MIGIFGKAASMIKLEAKELLMDNFIFA